MSDKYPEPPGSPSSANAFENFYPKQILRNPNRTAVPQLSLKSTLPTQLRITFDAAVATADAAVVVLNVAINDIGWSVEGTSKRDPADKPDRELGLLIALERALRKTANQIARQTTGRVEHNDQMRTQRKFQKLARDIPMEANVVEVEQGWDMLDPDAPIWMNPNAPTIVFDHKVYDQGLAETVVAVSKQSRKERKKQRAAR